MSNDLAGTDILGFRLVEQIGEGGMGSVWRAEHPETRGIRAIKVLDPLLARDRRLVERFVQEARVMMGLEHPNIVRVDNFSREQLAMVMEFVQGDTLSDLIGRKVGPIPFERALPLMKQILAAVEHAHKRPEPVIHRDIKPSNIMVTAEEMIKVMDFGIARVVHGARLTRTGTAMGTAAYMSPEQIKGAKNVDTRGDIYSIGVTFYEMLAGRPPFEGESDSDSDYFLKDAHVRRPPPDPRSFYPAIPEKVVQVVLEALEKDPAKRHQSTSDFRLALEANNEDIEVPSVQAEAPPPKIVSRPASPALEQQPRQGSAAWVPRYVWPMLGLLIIFIIVLVATSLSDAGSGSLIVNVDQEGARVELKGGGGVSKPVTPGRKTSGLIPGNYILGVQKDGFDTYEEEVEIRFEETTVKEVKLKRDEGGSSRVDLEWVQIPGGTYQMGSKTGGSEEKPEHEVRVDTFRLLKSEVTVAQYGACVTAGGCNTTDLSGRYCNWENTRRRGHPMNCVDWNQARAFCSWAGGRLPSESEWEYAARSGGKNWTFPWGNDAPTCNYAVMDDGMTKGGAVEATDGCGEDRTWAVCSKPAGDSTHGVCDLAGNVEEWIEDCWREDYTGATTNAKAWVEDCSRARRIRRGGRWNSSAGKLQATRRAPFSPTRGGPFLGFRCAR